MERHFFAGLMLLWVVFPAESARADQVDSHEAYIVNGTATEAGSLRATVAILDGSGEEAIDPFSPRTMLRLFRCSGVAIAPRVVATAAHCLSSSLFVAAGLRTLDDVWVAEVKTVERVVAHPLADVALLILESPVTMVTPVPVLADDAELFGQTAIAQGYGARVSPDRAGLLDQRQYASLLNETIVPIDELRGDLVFTEAGEGQSGPCFGDSGGPLYVQQRKQLVVAGFTSLLLPDKEGPTCGSRAIYVSAASVSGWIEEKMLDATLLEERGAAGSCSASTNPPPIDTLSFFAVVGLLFGFVSRMRSKALAPGVLIGVLGLATGCGSDSGGSLCDDRFDPTGDFCDDSVARIDLEGARARARDVMPDEAWLWSVASSTESGVNPDGKAEAWLVRYFVPGQIELPDALIRSVAVSASGRLEPYQELGTIHCLPTDPMPQVDSRELVHDAIPRLERAGATVRLGEGRLLHVLCSHRCARAPDEWGGVGFGNDFVYYDDDGDYLGMESKP